MPKASFRLTGKWDELGLRIDPRSFSRKEKRKIRKATERIGMLGRSELKRSIRKSWKRNSPLTVAMKRSTKTLVDHGELFKGVSYQMIGWNKVFVGVLKTEKNKAGESLANIAYALHEGVDITVTAKMRAFFYYLHMVSTGRMDENKLTGKAAFVWERIKGRKTIAKLKESTTSIRIPKRPFMQKAFSGRNFKSFVTNEWARAIDHSFAK